MQQDPDQLVTAAARLFEQGQTRAAEANCWAALAAAPRHRDARVMLGAALHAQGRHGEAERLYAELAAEEPTEAAHWLNVGLMRRLDGRHDEALAAFQHGALLGPMDADFAFNLGLLHNDRKDYASAQAVLARAAELAPEDAEIRYEYARACSDCLATEAAIDALRDWQTLEGVDVELAAKIAQLLTQLGEPSLAEPALRYVAAHAEASPAAALRLVGILERTNRLDEARAALERVLAGGHAAELGLDLTVAEAQLAARAARHDDAVRLYTRVLEATTALHEKHFQLYPLARSLDALGRHDEAWAALEDAHRSQLELLKMTSPGLVLSGAPTMEITRYGCDADDVARWADPGAPSAEASPIFIVAFPRSGTTLLELTLDAHPQLRSMDEQPFLQNALDDLAAAGLRYPAGLAAATPAQLETVRRAYWRRVRAKVELAPDQRLVDKNPLNLLRLPVIRRLFPSARVVLAIRDPRDVLLSCYMQHFRAPDFALMCRDLPTLALGYRRAFDFWYEQAALLRPSTLEIRYESFVADFGTQMRAVAEFLELPWDDALLEPAAHARGKAFISTPSYSQVVQPVTTRAVGRHARYAARFEPVGELLAPYLVRWGYDR